MPKLLLAINPLRFNFQSVEFACQVAHTTGSQLGGIFLENLTGEELQELAAESRSGNEILVSTKRNEIAEASIKEFKQICQNNSLSTSIHRRRGEPLHEIVADSRFADLIVVPSNISFQQKSEQVPTSFTRHLLNKSECPVIICLENLAEIAEIVFAYDGGVSSIFAMREFCHLFKEYSNRPLTILEVNGRNESAIHQIPCISEWLKSYFTNIHFQVLHGEPREELFKYLLNKCNLFLVLGSYGRGVLSSVFRDSWASLLLKTADFPIFITHR